MESTQPPAPTDSANTASTKPKKYKAAKIAVAVVLLIVSAVIAHHQLGGGETPSAAISNSYWFYDLGTHQLFVQSDSVTPPIAPPSKKERDKGEPGGVLAHIYSCGSCADKSTHFVAYLETFTMEAKAQLAEIGEKMPVGNKNMNLAPPRVRQRLEPIYESGQLVATGDKPDEWWPAASDQGKAILDAATSRCTEGQLANECRP